MIVCCLLVVVGCWHPVPKLRDRRIGQFDKKHAALRQAQSDMLFLSSANLNQIQIVTLSLSKGGS